MQLDRFDLAILTHLQEDARIPNTELAERVGLSASPCLRRVRRLWDAGIIRSAQTMVEPASVGLSVQAVVRVQMTRHSESETAAFEAAVRALPEVLTCYAATGATDYFMIVAARSLGEFGALVKRIGGLPGLRDIESSIVIDTVKPWSPLPLTGDAGT